MINIDINNQILQITTACVLLLLIIYFIYICMKDHRKDKEEMKELLFSLDENKQKKEKNIQKEEIIPEIDDSTQMINQDVEKEVEVVENKSEIEVMLEKMQQDLKAKSEDIVENFEKEQEEKSIISYQELLNSFNKDQKTSAIEKTQIKVENVDAKVDTVEEVDLLDEIDYSTPIHSYQEDLKPVENVEEIAVSKKETDKKFRNTEFISPIYGKMEGNFDYPKVPSFHPKEQMEFNFDSEIQNSMVEQTIEEFNQKLEGHNIDDYLEDFDFHGHMKIDSLEQTLDMPPISPEVKANEDFLQALKDFRKNLE